MCIVYKQLKRGVSSWLAMYLKSELIHFADVNVTYSVTDLAAMAFDITPATTFSGEASEGQTDAILPVGISTADASNFFDAAQLSA